MNIMSQQKNLLTHTFQHNTFQRAGKPEANLAEAFTE